MEPIELLRVAGLEENQRFLMIRLIICFIWLKKLYSRLLVLITDTSSNLSISSNCHSSITILLVSLFLMPQNINLDCYF